MARNLNVDISTKKWDEFKTTKFGIALDGYVYGPPKFDIEMPCANFNHHEEVDRLSTRSTCSQVLIAIRQGLLEAFKKNDKVNIEVFVNDCDQDVCLSWFILNNSWMSENVINPKINKLVHLEDMMDTCAGSYPFPIDLPALEEMEWVFEPYTRFRLNGGLDKKNPADYKSIIVDVENRILQYVSGAGKKVELDTRYDILYQSDDIVVVNEIGAAARLALLSSGIKIFISARKRTDNKWQYSIGKISKYIPLNLMDVVNTLNATESDKTDKWGGAETIIGSPRKNGSELHPELVRDILRQTLLNAKKAYKTGNG